MVNNSDTKVSYQGNGQTTVFPFSFPFIQRDYIKVAIYDSLTDETKTIDSDYYVDTVANAVIYPGYEPGQEPAEALRPPILPATSTITIYRQTDVDQLTDLGEKYPLKDIENMADKLTEIIQEQAETLGRAVKVPVGDPKTPEEKLTDLQNYVSAAAGSAANAAASEASAQRAAEAAATSEANAAESERLASGYADTASDAASRAEDSAISARAYNAPDYDKETTYQAGEVVTFTDGNSYRALQETTGHEPPNIIYWQKVTDYVGDDFFEVDEYGYIVPMDSPSHSRYWRVDQNGYIVPIEGGDGGYRPDTRTLSAEYLNVTNEGYIKHLRADDIAAQEVDADEVTAEVAAFNVLTADDIIAKGPWVDVRAFGAKGDGIHDDTAAIQAAIQASNNGAVFFPSGRYKVTSQINASNASCIFGDNAEIISGTNGLDYKFYVSNKTHFLFSNLKFNSNLVGRGSIYFDTCEDCKVDKCSFTGYTAEYGHYRTDSQIMDNASEGTIITNCLFYDNGNQYDAALETLNRCITSQDGHNCIISHCRFVNFNQGIVYTSPDLQVENCYFEGNNDNCIYGGGSATIVGNVFKNANDEDVVVGDGNFIINDNQFINGTNKLIAINANCTSMVVNGNTFVCQDSNKDPMIFYYRYKTYVIDDLLFTNNIVIAENEKNTGYGNYFYIGGFTHCQISGNSMLLASNIAYSRAIYFDNDAVGSTLNILNNRVKNKNIYVNCYLLNALSNIVTNINNNIYQNIGNADRNYEVDLTAYLVSTIANKLTGVVATVAKYRGYSVWNIKFTTTADIANYEQLFSSIGQIFTTTKLSDNVSMTTGSYSIMLRPDRGYILTGTAIPSGTTVKFQVMVGVDY